MPTIYTPYTHNMSEYQIYMLSQSTGVLSRHTPEISERDSMLSRQVSVDITVRCQYKRA